MTEKLRDFFDLLRETFEAWIEKPIQQMAGAVAYYAASSLIAMVLVIVLVSSLFLQEQIFQDDIARGVQVVLGAESTSTLRQAMEGISEDVREGSPVAAIGTMVVLLYSASRLFRRLKGAFNSVWGVEEDDEGEKVKSFVKEVLFSMVVVVLVGLAIMTVLLLNGVVFALIDSLDDLLLGVEVIGLVQGAAYVLLFVVMAAVFALLYRTLPDTHVAWRDVWLGGVVASLLFTLGQFGIGLYFDLTRLDTVYGAAGAFIVLLIWVYVAAQIIMFGAKLTQLQAERRGDKPQDEER